MVTKEHVGRYVKFDHCGVRTGVLTGFRAGGNAVIEVHEPQDHAGRWSMSPMDVFPVPTEAEIRADEREKLAKKFEGLIGYSFTPSTVARLIREG